jgi:hypothetical protein
MDVGRRAVVLMRRGRRRDTHDLYLGIPDDNTRQDDGRRYPS